uniref:SH3 domain-containing protein n=1 Tax=Oncorhynchus mykiss TaxID=8022 RepID=A0A8L0DVM5_ONCMY
SPITNMAVNVSYVYIFILCIHNFISKAAVEGRFSDFKSCADEECSMLLCRGKAFSDFTGPDCRFLPFKKGETIYVYYKLSSQRTNIWAGSWDYYLFLSRTMTQHTSRLFWAFCVFFFFE